MPKPWEGQSLGRGGGEGIFGGLELQDHPGPTAVLHTWPHTPPALGLWLLEGNGSLRVCGALHGAGGLCGASFWGGPGAVCKGPCMGEPSPTSQAVPTASPLWTLPSQAYSPGVGVRSRGAVGSSHTHTPEGEPTAA